MSVDVTVGAMDNYVYRVKYGQADILAGVIMQLYMGSIGAAGARVYSSVHSRSSGGAGLGQGRNAARVRRPGRPVGMAVRRVPRTWRRARRRRSRGRGPADARRDGDVSVWRRPATTWAPRRRATAMCRKACPEWSLTSWIIDLIQATAPDYEQA
jgi:hypothetical protein